MADMPSKASNPVQCANGGKHEPTTRETKIKGQHIKYTVCKKCNKIP